MASQEVKGLRELGNILRELPKNIGRNVLRSAVSSGAAVIRDEAKHRAPVDTGEMQKDIMIKRSRDCTDQKAIYAVYVRSGKKSRLAGKKRGVDRDSFYWRFIEFGHFSRPPDGGNLLRHTDRGDVNNSALASQVQTGAVRWIAAKPFMRPAFETKKEAAVEAIADKLRTRIPEEVAKLK